MVSNLDMKIFTLGFLFLNTVILILLLLFMWPWTTTCLVVLVLDSLPMVGDSDVVGWSGGFFRRVLYMNSIELIP